MQKKEVLVIFKTHLDVGYTDYSENVISKYINTYIPTAIKIGNELKGTDTPFVWTLGSWMVFHALKNDKDGSVEKAIRDGIINWHGLPFTTHTELMNKELFEQGLNISKELDRRFGRKTIAAKMTDVPGHTIGMVPMLVDSDVEFLHIGVNPATPLPPVPPVFKWKMGEKEITVMYQGDYGEVADYGDFILYFAHTGDNNGPQSAQEVIDIYNKIQSEFPDTVLRVATLNDVAMKVRNLKNLPIIDKEIGDSWIHGAATDPEKLSRYRKVLRNISQSCIGDRDFYDNLLLVPEHTWGMCVKKYFYDEEHYFPEELEKCKEERKTVELSWKEQRDYVKKAENALGITADYPIAEPDLNCFTETAIPDEFNLEISWQIFDNSDYERYKSVYMRCHVPWAIWDFTKVGLPDYKGGIYSAQITKAYKNDNATLLKLEFDSKISKLYGLPYFYLEIKDNTINLKWFGKVACRLPQACWLKFKGFTENWELSKLGAWIKPESIIGSPLISAVDEGVRNESVIIKPLDSALVAPYGRRLLQYNCGNLAQDMYFNLYNNIWNTNFPLWYADDAMFRFIVEEI